MRAIYLGTANILPHNESFFLFLNFKTTWQPRGGGGWRMRNEFIYL
jgi:hypothetical protein